MKRFNLTFRGEIHPEFDIEQVKTAFAALFQVSDPAFIEEIFSGEPVVLRSDMDRKTAAEYYLQISRAGAVAQIVPLQSAPAQSASARRLGRELLLTQAPGVASESQPRATAPSFPSAEPAAAEQNWAVSSRLAAGNGRSPGRLNGAAATRDGVDPVASAIMNANEEQARQIQAEAAEEIAGLQLSAELAEKNAAEEQRQLSGLAKQAEAQAREDTQRLRSEGESVTRQLDAALADISTAQQEARQALDAERRRLDQERSRSDSESKRQLKALKEQAVATVAGLDDILESIRRQERDRLQVISAEIELLEQRIAELRVELARGPEQLESLLQQARDDNEQRLESLHREGESTLEALRARKAEFEQLESEAERALQQRLAALEEQRAGANGDALSALARIKEREAEVARVLEDKLAKLQQREAAVRAEASDKLALLKAREQLVMERQARELAALQQAPGG